MNIDKILRVGQSAQPRGWADSVAGRQVLADVGASPDSVPGRRGHRWLRPLLVGAGGLLVVGAAGAAAVVALAPEPPPSWSVPSTSVGCAEERKANANLSIVKWRDGQRPVDVCREDWISRTGKAPERLFACVYRQDAGAGGGVIVIPGDEYATAAEACGSIHMYLAPDNIKPNPAKTNVPSHPGRVTEGGTA